MTDRARYDVNNQPSLMAVSNADGSSPVDLWADPSTHALVTSGGSGGSSLVAAPLVGQAKIAVTSTAVQLNGGTSQPLTNGIIISAGTGNAASIEIGTSGVNATHDGTGNGYILAAGASVSFAVNNTNAIYINGTANDYVSWAGS